jgi:hypothetical protein
MAYIGKKFHQVRLSNSGESNLFSRASWRSSNIGETVLR